MHKSLEKTDLPLKAFGKDTSVIDFI